MKTWTAVSIHASRAEIDALNRFAKARGKRTGQMLRDLIRREWGEALYPNFAAPSIADRDHTDRQLPDETAEADHATV